MLIEEMMPRPDWRLRHERVVRGDAVELYRRARAMGIRSLWEVRVLLWLREWPSRLFGLPLEEFPVVAEQEGREVVRAICGPFWQVAGNIEGVPVEEMAAYEREGSGKAYWNFFVEEMEGGMVRVVTETRVECYGERAKQRFGWYWRVVGPFAGWIRGRMMAAVTEGGGPK